MSFFRAQSCSDGCTADRSGPHHPHPPAPPPPPPPHASADCWRSVGQPPAARRPAAG